MDHAIDVITGETITAAQALEKRLTQRSYEGFQCSECGHPASLRARGKGDSPFFSHHPRSPEWCSLRAGTEDWGGPREPGTSADLNTLSDFLREELASYRVLNIAQILPVDTDRTIAKFLSWGIDLSDHTTTTDENVLRLLYQPRFVILLRWLCAVVEARPKFPQRTPEELARTIRNICLRRLPFVETWRNNSSVTARPTKLSSQTLNRPREFWCVSDLGGSRCFATTDGRASIVEVATFPLTLELLSENSVTVSMYRHSLSNNFLHAREDLRLGISSYRLLIPEPQGIIISPNYDLRPSESRHPLLYVLPHRDAQ